MTIDTEYFEEIININSKKEKELPENVFFFATLIALIGVNSF